MEVFSEKNFPRARKTSKEKQERKKKRDVGKNSTDLIRPRTSKKNTMRSQETEISTTPLARGSFCALSHERRRRMVDEARHWKGVSRYVGLMLMV